jgi:hypothetical protein
MVGCSNKTSQSQNDKKDPAPSSNASTSAPVAEKQREQKVVFIADSVIGGGVKGTRKNPVHFTCGANLCENYAGDINTLLSEGWEIVSGNPKQVAAGWENCVCSGTEYIIQRIVTPSAVVTDQAVKCEIYSNGKIAVNGKCKLFPEKGGSFALSSLDGKPLLENIIDVSVTITGEGIAEVRGLTTDGINSRWGEAKRSPIDKACWEGSDFKVCVR